MNDTKKQRTILLSEEQSYAQHKIKADQMPKVTEPIVFIVSVLIAILGCIVGLQVQINTGTTPDTSIIGAIFAVLIAQISSQMVKMF